MADLIGRLSELRCQYNCFDENERDAYHTLSEAIKALSEQPERKTGKWIIDRGLYKCSSCNQLWAEWWAISKPIERMRKEMPYCPMCGSYNGEESDGVEEDD